jgi:hypothetical protein
MGACHEVDVATLPSGRTRTRRTGPSELFAFVSDLRRLADDPAPDDADRAENARPVCGLRSFQKAVPSVQCMLYRLRVRREWPDRKTKQHRCVSLDRRQCATGSAGRQVTLDAAPSRRSPGSSVPPVLVPLTVGGYGVSRLKYWLALFGAKACPNIAVASSPALSSPM